MLKAKDGGYGHKEPIRILRNGPVPCKDNGELLSRNPGLFALKIWNLVITMPVALPLLTPLVSCVKLPQMIGNLLDVYCRNGKQ
ncbi:MAG: hypothetical protein HW380_3785 [Magnetococcales bacterium]|nr:hypothetical protein [Magnetococcales bacterium]